MSAYVQLSNFEGHKIVIEEQMVSNPNNIEILTVIDGKLVRENNDVVDIKKISSHFERIKTELLSKFEKYFITTIEKVGMSRSEKKARLEKISTIEVNPQPNKKGIEVLESLVSHKEKATSSEHPQKLDDKQTEEFQQGHEEGKERKQ